MFGAGRSSGEAATRGDRAMTGGGGRRPLVLTLGEIRSAWRVAYVVVGDNDLATRAVTKAYLGASEGRNVSDGINLLGDTLRIALTRATTSAPTPTESAVITALWQLPPEQRAALWLSQVEKVDNHTLGSVLGLLWTNAGPIAERATEWLDVALDHHSGPLCEREPALARFLVGELPPDEVPAMQAHLSECPTCGTKSRAMDELVDLEGVLDKAVPEPPDTLTVPVLEAQAVIDTPSGPPTLHEEKTRTPAVRTLAMCCVVLVVLGVIGLAVVGKKHTSDLPASGSVIHAGSIRSADNTTAGGVGAASSTDPSTGATSVTVTTTSLPPLTFPTVPPRGAKKSTTKK